MHTSAMLVSLNCEHARSLDESSSAQKEWRRGHRQEEGRLQDLKNGFKKREEVKKVYRNILKEAEIHEESCFIEKKQKV